MYNCIIYYIISYHKKGNIMKPKALEIIRCPVCGCEYLPAEIFLPNAFLGKPSHIMKQNKHIDAFDGASMNTQEVYICDECNSSFKIFARVTFNTVENTKQDFENDYITPLQKNSLFLSEE